MHRLLQIVAHFRLTRESKIQCLESAISILGVICPSPDWDEEGWRLWPALVPHLAKIFELVAGQPNEFEASSLMLGCGLWLKHQGRYAEAELLYRRSLRLDEEQFGCENENVAIGLNNLGRLLNDWGKHDDAEIILRRALNIAASNPEKDLYCSITSNLVQTLAAKGEWPQAEALILGLLSAQASGEVLRDGLLATCLADLASVEHKSNRVADAEAHYRESLSIFDRNPEANARHIAVVLGKLGELLIERANLEDAGPFLERALEVKRKCFGETHANVIDALHALGLHRTYSKDFESAVAIFRKALELLDSATIKDPSLAARIYSNLGFAFFGASQLQSAEDMMRKSLLITEHEFGVDSSLAATRSGNLGFILYQFGKWLDAESFLRRHLRAQIQTIARKGCMPPEFGDSCKSYITCLRHLDFGREEIQRRVNELIGEVGEEDAKSEPVLELEVVFDELS